MPSDRSNWFIGTFGGNLSRFIISRPPVTIMILVVAALCCSLFTLAVYVQYNQMPDLEATKGYSNLLKKLGVLTFCLTNYTKQLNHTDIKKELKRFGDTEFVNISLPLFPMLTVQGNFSHSNLISEISGVMPYFLLFNHDNHIHSVALHVFLKKAWKPENCLNDTCNHMESCVVLQIKRDALPGGEMLQPTCNPSQYKSNYSMIYMDQKKAERNKRSQCESGLQMHLNPILGQDVKVFLNVLEKAKIKYRLHISSYIFFVVLLSMLIFAVLKSRSKQDQKILQS
ncbi:uncharacterized protein LOC130623336 [Hydractinia symbiolongicarpus]|uniref:uncharacterized protein LOC130623336 n=1 Tax=Hydractinia symbiolongicarpus TaxID=13093 RepID=UPI002549FCBC|nr:uncharacterized protein LOC130623336 [Hydractinia symbiolongicarpus]